MKVKELLEHIDGCFKVWITEKDRKTTVVLLTNKWELPEYLKDEIIDNWLVCEERVKVSLAR